MGPKKKKKNKTKKKKTTEKAGWTFCAKMILMIENCSTKMKDVVSGDFHVVFCRLPPLSRSLCLTLMVRHKMWPVDVHLGARKTHFSYASNFIWMTPLPGQGLALSLPPFLFSHFFISPLPSFFFLFFFYTIRIASTQGRPSQLCSKLS